MKVTPTSSVLAVVSLTIVENHIFTKQMLIFGNIAFYILMARLPKICTKNMNLMEMLHFTIS